MVIVTIELRPGALSWKVMSPKSTLDLNATFDFTIVSNKLHSWLKIYRHL